jgi:hypothetical protein
MAISAQRNQVLLAILSALTAELLVVYLQPIPTATVLASPSISFQDLQAQSFVRLGVQTLRNSFLKYSVHDALPFTWVRNSSLWSLGRNL